MSCSFSTSLLCSSVEPRLNTCISSRPQRGGSGFASLRSTRRRPTVSVRKATPETQQLRKTEEKLQQKREEERRHQAADDEQTAELRDVWRQAHGSDNWEGMLDPMNDILRKEIIRYGEFSQACYDVFDSDPYSIYCGTCKYPRSRLLQEVGLGNRGYTITRYLYATSNINVPTFFLKPRSPENKLWSPHANWIGFVAVATDDEEIQRLGRRDIVIAWRGTVTNMEWIADLTAYLRTPDINPLHPHPEIRVEAGFLRLYTASETGCAYCSLSARQQIESEIRRLTNKYQGEPLSITLTGHSLGSALATVSAYDIAEMGLNSGPAGEQIPVTVFSFSGPRVGNAAFRKRCQELGVRILRILNVDDAVPKVPGMIFNEKTTEGLLGGLLEKLPWFYSHVGTELALNRRWSSFLKDTEDLGAMHDLEGLLHLLDGYSGSESQGPVWKRGERDPALVNKYSDLLKDEHAVPPRWRQDFNRGLVLRPDGCWVQPPRSHHVHRTDEGEDDASWMNHHWEVSHQ